jgi:CRP-like cAMP-binding protein
MCVGGLYKKNEPLFMAGKAPEWMFYVVAGEVTLVRLGLQGYPVVLQRTNVGFVSEASLKVVRYHCNALAVTDTSVIKVPVKEMVKALSEDPELASRWIAMLNREVMRLRLHCERLSMKSVRDRIFHLIQTEGTDGNYSVPSGLKNLAGELGVTHEALYRTMADLQKSGLISRSGDNLVLSRK